MTKSTFTKKDYDNLLKFIQDYQNNEEWQKAIHSLYTVHSDLTVEDLEIYFKFILKRKLQVNLSEETIHLLAERMKQYLIFREVKLKNKGGI